MFLSYGWPGNGETAEYYRERCGSVRDGYHYDQDIPESIRGKYEENQGATELSLSAVLSRQALR